MLVVRTQKGCIVDVMCTFTRGEHKVKTKFDMGVSILKLLLLEMKKYTTYWKGYKYELATLT